MIYFLDTEFHEGFNKPLFGRRRHFIDLISIAIVAEDGRAYYAISRDFDIKAAWNSWQLGQGKLINSGMEKIYPREYWLRQNVLKPLFKELWYDKCHMQNLHHCSNDFTYKNFSKLIGIYGKTNTEIASEIQSFCAETDIEFCGYYADYDWVVMCSLFGKMISLPKGFPMYCRDLKQSVDDLAVSQGWYYGRDIWSNTRQKTDADYHLLQEGDRPATLKECLQKLKTLPGYPKQ